MASQRTAPCSRCGTSVTKRARNGRPWVCLDCAELATAANALQLAAGSGPAYDEWRTAWATKMAKVLAGYSDAAPVVSEQQPPIEQSAPPGP